MPVAVGVSENEGTFKLSSTVFKASALITEFPAVFGNESVS